jgi:PAS domain S-box-containing protein
LLEELLPRNHQVIDFEMKHKFEQIGTRTMRLNARRLVQAAGQAPLFLLAIEDVTEQEAKEALLACHRQALEMLAKGERLEQVLDFLAASMESQSRDEFLVAIHLLEEDGRHFGQVAAPSLPASYAQATKGMDASLQMGPCSSAVTTHEPTVVRDFAVETRWPAFIAEAVSLGLRACFTTPIFSSYQRILGTFAIYYRAPRDPSPNDRELVEIVTRTASIAIERRQAEQVLRDSEEGFRNLADNMSQLAWTCDKLGDVTWYNQRWLDYTGLTFEEMKDWGWKQCHHPDHVDRVVASVQRSQETGEPWDATFPLRGKDGAYRWFLSRAAPIRDAKGNVVEWFGTNTDITEQRRMADELRQNAAEMAESDRRKNEFLAMLAHELRNPLAPIRNAAQGLRLMKDAGEAVQSASAMMERQVGQMVRLVDDLLDVSRITRGKIELRRGRVELASIIHLAAEAARPLAESMGHNLTVALPTEPIYLNADPTRLAQAVGNLLTNACKFTNKGGHISVTVEAVSGERERPEAAIRVQDNGIGIPADKLPHIFDLFMQVDTTLERSISGLGIGLTLVKNLVEMHGGTVEVRSAGVGQGSEFLVRLPILAGTPEPPPSPLAPDPSPLIKGRRILIVDDNRDSAASLAMLLKLTGNETYTAFDGLEAVKAAAMFRPDMAVLDIGLPKLNGYEAARKIREQPEGKKMVLVALTGWGQDEDRRKSTEAGFDGHIVKPVDYITLMKLLAELQAAKE